MCLRVHVAFFLCCENEVKERKGAACQFFFITLSANRYISFDRPSLFRSTNHHYYGKT